MICRCKQHSGKAIMAFILSLHISIFALAVYKSPALQDLSTFSFMYL